MTSSKSTLPEGVQVYEVPPTILEEGQLYQWDEEKQRSWNWQTEGWDTHWGGWFNNDGVERNWPHLRHYMLYVGRGHVWDKWGGKWAYHFLYREEFLTYFVEDEFDVFEAIWQKVS